MSHPEFGDVEAATAAFDDSPFLMLVSEGVDHVVTAANKGCRQAVGSRPLIGRPGREAVPELSRGGWWERFDQVIRTGEGYAATGFRTRMPRPDGSLADVCLDVFLTPRRGVDGRICGVVAVGHDVTARARSGSVGPRATAGAPDVVTALQDALLPDGLPVLPGLTVSAQYLLADDDRAAGGDWFDAIVLPDDRLALVVGDVVGRGVGAAAAMGRLRAILQERLESGAGVAAALDSLNRFASGSPEAAGTTLCIVAVDQRTGDLDYVTAGHPAPLVVDRRGGFRYLAPSGAPPLTARSLGGCSRDRLGRGELLVLYSDGLLDRPGRSSAHSTLELGQLAAAVLRGQGGPGGARPADSSGAILERMVADTGYRDDVTVLTAELRSPPDSFERSLPPERSGIRRLRTELGAWLDSLSARPLDKQALLHAVTEVVANAVDHAYPATGSGDAEPAAEGRRVSVHGELTSTGQVTLTVRDSGRWRSGDSRADGRGLALAGGLVDRLRVRSGDGTTVTIDHRMTRPTRIMQGRGAGSRPVGPTSPAEEGSNAIEVALGTVRVRGPLDWATADELRAGLLRATRAGSHEAVVDLTEVTRLAGPAVQVLCEALERNQRHHTELSLVAPAGTPAQHVLEVVAMPYATGRPLH